MHLHHRSAVAIVTALLAACAAAPTHPTVDAVDFATRAAGGRAAAEKMAALEYRLHIAEATFQVDAVYYVDRRGRMRIDILAEGKRVYTEVYDGTRAWDLDASGKASAETGEGAQALWRGTQYPGQILAFDELPAHGHRVEAAGSETIGDRRYHKLKLTMSDGYVTWRYVDAATGQLDRGRDVRPLHPAVDPTPTTIETVWSDYRPIDGVMRSFHSEQHDLATGKWLQTTELLSVRTLPALDEALFALPAGL
jgi:hypothetical protein